jgi:trigger factor
MKVSVTNTGTCRQTLKIEVPAETVAAERAELVSYYAKGVAVPGFRKGHAPKALVEKRFAKELAADLKDRVVPKFYHEAVAQEKVKVVAVIDVSEPELTEGQPLKFEVTVDVPPEFKLPKYEGISIKAEKTDVSDKQVDETVESILRQHATYEEVTGRAAKEKDMVQVSYESTIDGQPVEEKVPQARGMGKGSGYWITCDNESFLPGMGLALIGTKLGDKKNVTVKFPKDYIVKELSGLEAEFKVEVTGMRESKLPELNEELLKKLHVASEEELRTNIRTHMEESARNREAGRQQDLICEFLLEKTKLDVPESAVKEQIRTVMYEMARERMYRGMSQDQITAQREEMIQEARTKADAQVRLRYIMMAIADAENIQVTDDEVSVEIARIAVSQRRDAAEYRKQLEKDDQLDSVKEQIRFGKAIDLLHEKAKIK